MPWSMHDTAGLPILSVVAIALWISGKGGGFFLVWPRAMALMCSLPGLRLDLPTRKGPLSVEIQ